MAKKPDEVELVDEADVEVVTDVSEGGEPGSTRTLRVYDEKGDFTIQIPSDAKVTFGYFNPGAPSPDADLYGNRRGRSDAERRTALRIYKNEKQQLAVFLGVKGFRDESIKLVRLRQRVVIETNYEDNGEGSVTHRGSEQRQLVASPEPDTYT